MATFSVQAQPTDAASWTELARTVEAAGFDALFAADHPGAARHRSSRCRRGGLTSTLGLGSYVSTRRPEPILLPPTV
ncbi:F420-dependent oxidoreductase, partial [Micromonospora provocatoris]